VASPVRLLLVVTLVAVVAGNVGLLVAGGGSASPSSPAAGDDDRADAAAPHRHRWTDHRGGDRGCCGGRDDPDADQPAVRLLVVVALYLATVGFGMAALAGDLRERDARRPSHTEPPRHPVLICNPWSGGGKVAKFDLVELAEGLGVEVVMLAEGLDLEELARDAVARGADCLGMAGGDGSQALVASIAVEHDLPFVVVCRQRTTSP
jgi:hypothetical protein